MRTVRGDSNTTPSHFLLGIDPKYDDGDLDFIPGTWTARLLGMDPRFWDPTKGSCGIPGMGCDRGGLRCAPLSMECSKTDGFLQRTVFDLYSHDPRSISTNEITC